MRRAMLLCCLAAACGGGTDANKDGIADGVRTPDSVSQIAPSTPIGSLSGQVLRVDFKGLEGVKVTAVVGGVADPDGVAYTATTNTDGVWAVKGLPAGATAQVLVSKEGYTSTRVQVVVPGAAGNFPINNGNGNAGTLLLPELKDELRFQVVTATGRPAAMVKAQLEVTPAAVRTNEFGTYGTAFGVHWMEAETDMSGALRFPKAPALAELARLGGTYSVSIGGYDENNDGRFDVLGTRRDFPARDLYLGTAVTTITLPVQRGPGPLNVIASNVDSMVNGVTDPLRSMVKSTETLFFTFDQNVLLGSISVKVTDETGLNTIANTKVLKAPNVLEVALTPPPEQGREYNIALRATSAENGSTFARSAYFFGGDPATPKVFGIEKVTYRRPPGGSTMMRLEVGDRVVITFNQPLRQVGAQPLEVQFDYDINALNGKGDVAGERSPTGAMNPQTAGFVAAANEPVAEPMSTFSNLASTYTTRYEFTYGAPGTVSVPLGTPLFFMFAKIPSSLTGYRTLWGTSIEAEASAVLSSP